jgi:hypothetical protein
MAHGLALAPALHCKNPSCGSPPCKMFLPYVAGQEAIYDPPHWPKAAWRVFLICPHCKHGNVYHEFDVHWDAWSPEANQTYGETSYFFIDSKCSQPSCGLPIRICVGTYQSYSNDIDTNEALISAAFRGDSPLVCPAGHSLDPDSLQVVICKCESVIEP